MKALLTGKTALITGGTSGIGEATVKLFVAEGAKVMFTGRNNNKGAALAEQCQGQAEFYPADVLDEAQISGAVEATLERFGHLDILFNNAGGPVEGGVETSSTEQLHHATDLLLGSIIHSTKYVVPHMKQQGFGRIVNNASIASHRTHYGRYLYSAMKAAVSHLGRVAAVELGGHGITVNTVSPGQIATPIFIRDSLPPEGISASHEQAKLNKLARLRAHSSPLLRMGQPQEVASAVLFLVSELGSFVNGHDLVVDGGAIVAGRGDFSASAP